MRCKESPSSQEKIQFAASESPVGLNGVEDCIVAPTNFRRSPGDSRHLDRPLSLRQLKLVKDVNT